MNSSKKDEILQEKWLDYLDWWNGYVKNERSPPTEDNFWVWYCEKHLDKKDN